MDRREFVALASVTLLGGCVGGDGGGNTPTATAQPTATPTATATQTASPTPTPRPASLEIATVTAQEPTVGEPWRVRITVRNRGEQSGAYRDTVEYRVDGGEWAGATGFDVTVSGKSTTRRVVTLPPVTEPGSVEIRLRDVDVTWSTTAARPQSEFQGPTEEDQIYVDLQYRDYYDHEVAQIREEASSLIYETLLRDAEQNRGLEVTYDGTVMQRLISETHNTYFIRIDGEPGKEVYASYVSDQEFIRGDQITFWGQVLGFEIYQGEIRTENTVPAIAIADAELNN